MRKSIVGFLIGWAALTMPGSGNSQEKKSEYPETRLLTEEYALAKTPQSYFLFDLKNRTLELKMRGFVLKRWTVQYLRLSGEPVSFRALEIEKKSAMVLPERRVIKPGEEDAEPATPKKPGEFRLEALEVTDMPVNFTIELNNGTRISVMPNEKKFSKRLKNFKRYIALSFRSLRANKRRQKISGIEIAFADPKDGQSLYWALNEGTKGLVWFPKSD